MNIENNVLDLNSVKPLISRLSKLKTFSISIKMGCCSKSGCYLSKPNK